MYNIILIFLFSLQVLYAQNVTNKTNSKGKYLPAEGTIRVLFLFAEFPDDEFESKSAKWPKSGKPDLFDNWIDKEWSSNATKGSLTHYFNEMSFNRLKFIGDSYKITIPHPRSYYADKIFEDVNKDIILEADKVIDFDKYDNWDYEGTYNHIQRKDKIVEMIFIIYRSIEADQKIKNFRKTAKYDRYGFLGNSNRDITVDDGKRIVKTGFYGDQHNPGGSGVTLIDYYSMDMFKFTIHEFAHYLLGGNEEHSGFAFWGMLSDWGTRNYNINSYERERLGWIKPKVITIDKTTTLNNISIGDYITTGEVYKLKINDNESFYLENHQNLSFWEQNRSDGKVEKGLYVLRQQGRTAHDLELIPADGRFNWEVKQTIKSPWGDNLLPVFKRLKSNRKDGQHDCQFIAWSLNKAQKIPEAIHFTENKSGQPEQNVLFNGDGRDAFRPGYQEVFSPWSNPNSQLKNKKESSFGFQIKSIKNNKIVLDLFVNTSETAPPSKPQDVEVLKKDGKVFLQWTPNIEPDIKEYKVYKEVSNKWSLLGKTSKQEYFDNAKNGKYKVTAVDEKDLESVHSDEVSIN